MNKEMILGISGLAATVLVSVLVISFLTSQPERTALKQTGANTVIVKDMSAHAVEARENKEPISAGNAHNGIQNCFVNFMTAMCKIFPGEAGASFFNGTMVCPTNFPRSG